MGILIAFIFVLVGKILLFILPINHPPPLMMMNFSHTIDDAKSEADWRLLQRRVRSLRRGRGGGQQIRLQLLWGLQALHAAVQKCQGYARSPHQSLTDYFQFNEVPNLSGERLRSLPAIQPQTSLLSPLLNWIIATFTSKLGKLVVEIVFKFRLSQL